MTIDDFKRQDGYECPTCNKLLNTSLGLKQHHTKVHDESLCQTAVCKWCGDGFRARPSAVNNFCSKECQMERRKQEGLSARKRRVVIQCPGCDRGFEVRYSEIGHKIYCTPECRRTGEYIDCEVCDTNFYASGSYGDRARFCSQDCYGAWISANKSGSNSVHWKGDGAVDTRPPYGPGFNNRKRELVRERDGRECTRCGMSNKEHAKRFAMALHVHHEVKARGSTNPAVHNAPRNLRTLCAPCHRKIEPVE